MWRLQASQPGLPRAQAHSVAGIPRPPPSCWFGAACAEPGALPSACCLSEQQTSIRAFCTQPWGARRAEARAPRAPAPGLCTHSQAPPAPGLRTHSQAPPPTHTPWHPVSRAACAGPSILGPRPVGTEAVDPEPLI